MSRKPLIASLALLTLIGACRRGEPAPLLAPAARAPAARWHDGDVYVYRIDLESRARVAESSAPMGFTLKGKLEIRPRVSGDTVMFLASVRDPEVRAEGDTVPTDLARDLAGPWGFEIADGRARSLHLHGGPDPLSVTILSALAATFQGPNGPGEGDAWQVEETDGSGRYQARYAAGAEPGSFVKTKLSYRKEPIPIDAGAFGALDWTPTVIGSTAAIRFQGDDLVAVNARDELDAGLSTASRVRVTMRLDLALDQRVAGGGEGAWASLWASTRAVEIGAPISSPRPTHALDRRDASGVTFEQALAALEQPRDPGAAAGSAESGGGKLGAFRTMVAVLRTRPEAVPGAVAAVDRASPARKSLLDALGSAGSPQAQAALVREMTDRRSPEEVRRRAAFALIRTAHPTEASVSALLTSLGEVSLRPYAIYGLGSYARRLREAGEAALATRAGDALIAALDATTDGVARVDVLRGIANAGDARALAKVRPLLDDADPSIRAAAVDAMRLMRDPEVDALLEKLLAPDESQEVLLAALDAVALRASSAAIARAVATAAATAPGMQCRIKAVRVLEKWLGDRPEVRPTLERIAHDDGEEAVRSAARAALTR